MRTSRDDFVDRIVEIERLNTALHAEGFEKESLVLMHGQRGIGKTQLLARFLRICRANNISITYIDLPGKDYLGIIDKIEEDLGPRGFESLEQTYTDVILRAQVIRGQAALDNLAQPNSPTAQSTTAGFTFNGAVTADTQNFINGNVTYKNPQITNIFNIELGEPQQVKKLSERKITQSFYECLRTITQEHTIAILLDHWEDTNEPLKIWLHDHLLSWVSELSLKKALVVLCREALPQELENQTGILSLGIPEFPREVALEYWRKNDLPEAAFEELTSEIYSIPRILALEVDRRKQILKISR